MNKREQALGELHDEIVEALRQRIRTGEFSPQDMKNAIQLLKDNGVTAEVREGEPLAALYDELPFDEYRN